MFSLSTLFFTIVDWTIVDGTGTLFSVEQAFVGRDEIQPPLKTPVREARFSYATHLHVI